VRKLVAEHHGKPAWPFVVCGLLTVGAALVGGALTGMIASRFDRVILALIGIFGAAVLCSAAMALVIDHNMLVLDRADLAADRDRLAADLDAERSRLQAATIRFSKERADTQRRLARDLHDGAQQRLLALVMKLHRVQRIVATPSADTAAEEAVHGAIDEVELVIGELRAFSHGLNPPSLEVFGLGGAIEELTERMPLPLDVHVPDGRFRPEVELTAYFVVSEALTNIMKHARASHAKIDITASEGTLHIEVTDNGVGGADSRHGTGLAGLGQRVAELDGEMIVNSPQGQGTNITVRLPCG